MRRHTRHSVKPALCWAAAPHTNSASECHMPRAGAGCTHHFSSRVKGREAASPIHTLQHTSPAKWPTNTALACHTAMSAAQALNAAQVSTPGTPVVVHKPQKVQTTWHLRALLKATTPCAASTLYSACTTCAHPDQCTMQRVRHDPRHAACTPTPTPQKEAGSVVALQQRPVAIAHRGSRATQEERTCAYVVEKCTICSTV